MKKRNGFTLVELLAVIVILAIILVIAVPKVMNIIEDAKKATLESTAKMIASQAEKQKVQNTVLGNTDAITCDSVAKVNKVDYAGCSIGFDDNVAKVTIEGKGKFAGLWVCNGTKTSALATKESCSVPIEVKHPLFLKGQELTLDKFEVTLIESDGKTRNLWKGGLKSDDSQAVTITSPNWPENYPDNMTKEENTWEYTFEGADEIQISCDKTSYIRQYDTLSILNRNEVLYTPDFFQPMIYDYTIDGDYVKITLESDSSNNSKGFSCVIKPFYNVDAEYTVSPSVVPNTDGNFDITITVKDKNITKKISTKTTHDIEEYIASLLPFEGILNNKLEQTNVEYEGTTYDAGIRYAGYSKNYVKNKVYYNCDDTDTNGVAYGQNNYNYANSCEVWNILGVFDTKLSIDATPEKRVKLINTNSTFKASWDWNEENGINQWGKSTYADGSEYEGADIMRLLNGYYVGEDSVCTYFTDCYEDSCSQTCTAESLNNKKMKVLTSTAKNMIENAVWYTYAVTWASAWNTETEEAYLQERGISEQYTGKSLCEDDCIDTVNRTTSWTGLVGLMYKSDRLFARGWILDSLENYNYPWTMTPLAGTDPYYQVWEASDMADTNYAASDDKTIFPTVYLKQRVKVISGNGADKPYVLALN